MAYTLDVTFSTSGKWNNGWIFLPQLNLTVVLEKGWFSFIFESSDLVDKVLEL